MKKTAIIWFREDLRIADNPALQHAIVNYDAIIPLFILDERVRRIGGASRWFLHHVLEELSLQLEEKYSIKLVIKQGKSEDIIDEMLLETGVSGFFWNRIYEKQNVERDKKIKEILQGKEVNVKSFNGSLLVEPWQVETGSGEFYKVYTPFAKKAKAEVPVRSLVEVPESQNKSVNVKLDSLNLCDLNLLPSDPDWGSKMLDYWVFSEKEAEERLEEFISDRVQDYGRDRDRPDRDGTSSLSPYFHFGVISPQQAYHKAMSSKNHYNEQGVEKFISEIYWREFSYNLMFHFPEIATKNFRPEFDNFPWIDIKEAVHKWQWGKTGYPIIDAGMRELYETGYMHNRVRMLVGSFLTKHLLTHWKHGEEWFWECLVDASPANNAASWQWVAGCGADAAPYFRIFNPISQGTKFDPHGDYVRRWVPELTDMPNEFIHKPWDAPLLILKAADVELGYNYPNPIVDHFKARKASLKAYEKIKKKKD